MQVLLHVDMEGTAGITSYRGLWPAWSEYWEVGRPALTADVAAVVAGLMAGGATAVIIDDQHASGVQNVIPEQLPAGALFLSPDEIWRAQREGGFDAVFQVGRHARRGANHGFVPHTMLPGMAVAIDGAPLTESHIFAYRAGLPLLGIVGDDTLATQIDGPLAGTPYLAVKRSLGRGTATPAFDTPQATSDAIEAFARRRAMEWKERRAPVLPASFTFAASLSATAIERVDDRTGLERTGPHSVRCQAESWWNGAEPALQAIMGATWQDLPSLTGEGPDHIDALGSFITSWIERDETVWDA